MLVVVRTGTEDDGVTSLAEVWVEIAMMDGIAGVMDCHFPRGSVG